jgi:threonine-phosphate decarboxylase
MLAGHGDDIHKNYNIKANFSTNVWYDSDINWLKKLVNEKWEVLTHYPEPDALSLRKVIVQHHNIEENQVIAANGATEIFYLLAHAFYGAKTLIPVPSFAEYEDACSAHNHQLSFCGLEEIDSEKNIYDLIIICNPNNPNGKVYSQNEIVSILKTHLNAHLLIDEAFIDFTTETKSSVGLLKDYPNLLISRSMTKNFSIPGLRLGYLIGNTKTINRINKYKQPWSVNALAIEAGKYLIENSSKLLPDALKLNRERELFSKVINTIPGFKAIKSAAPFFLIKSKMESAKLKQALVDKHDILIRDASNFKSLNNHYIRVNTLSEEKNSMLINALKDYEL